MLQAEPGLVRCLVERGEANLLQPHLALVLGYGSPCRLLFVCTLLGSSGIKDFQLLLRKADLIVITTLFWDIGGVILTNGWDHGSRLEAAKTFDLDWDEFRERHDLTFPAFDAGQISLDQYLGRTVFYRPRDFSREEFTAFMFAQSKEYPDTRGVLSSIARTGKYLIGAINNEPRELNQYRIEAFHLCNDFQLFFSSCYLHARKPEEPIYRVALEVTQRAPETCVFIDDRALNLENPRRMGMNVVHHQCASQLAADLKALGIAV
jgi:putative hydrolase of the HAD superfamily